MKKTSLLLLCLVLLALFAKAQQLPHYSQYLLNPLLLNPAISGTDNYVDLRAGYRNQWVGLEGAPTSYYLSAHMPLGRLDYMVPPTSARPQSFSKEEHKISWRPQHRSTSQKPRPHHGMGILVQSDEAGGLKRTDVQATYAYHVPLTARMKLAAGVAVGITQYGLNRELITFTNPSDPVVNSGDYHRTRPNLGVGLLAYDDKFFAGISLAQVLPAPFSFRTSNTAEIPARQQRHLYAHGGYRFQITKEVSFMPSLVAKYVNTSPLSLDVNAKVFFRDQFWLGGSYRRHDATVAMAGVQLKNRFSFGYAYDFTSSSLNTVSHGSHEIVLGLLLRNRREVYSPSQYW